MLFTCQLPLVPVKSSAVLAVYAVAQKARKILEYTKKLLPLLIKTGVFICLKKKNSLLNSFS